MDPTVNLHVDPNNFLSDLTQFRRLICKLIYLTHSHSDIYFSVCKLNQFVSNLTTHFNTALRIIRYLKNSLATRLYFKATFSLTLIGFTDVDWGSYALIRRSTTCFCFYLGSSLICWKSKKQQVVSHSSFRT